MVSRSDPRNFSPLLEREIAGHQGRAAFVGGLKTSNSSSAPDFDSGTNPRSSTISDVAVPKFWFVAVLCVVLQVSNADKFVAERLSCVLRLPNRKGCR
jgi:hypothetical protein